MGSTTQHRPGFFGGLVRAPTAAARHLCRVTLLGALLSSVGGAASASSGEWLQIGEPAVTDRRLAETVTGRSPTRRLADGVLAVSWAVPVADANAPFVGSGVFVITSGFGATLVAPAWPSLLSGR